MENLRKDRPTLPEVILEGISTPAEEFQNKVLRPIIKMQSDLLMAHISAQLKTLNVDWERLKPIKKKETLTTLLSKDQAFKSEITGMIIGHFNLDEFKNYLVLQKEINRRINQIVMNRAIDLLIR